MTASSRPAEDRLAFYLTCAAVAVVLLSNSAANVLIGAAIVALGYRRIRHGESLRTPPVLLPLGIFFALTVLAAAFSGHSLAEGWPGIRKFYLCAVLFLVAATFRAVPGHRRPCLWTRLHDDRFRGRQLVSVPAKV